MSSKQLVAISPAKGKFANITWQVSDVCNFRCSYCNPGNYGAKHRNLDLDRYLGVLDRMICHFRDHGYEDFKFFFSGGEPTIWPPFIEICRFIRASTPNATIAVNTNLSRPLGWWQENAGIIDDVVASFHVEGTNKERYLENAMYLQHQLSYLACRMLMHDERFQEVVDFAETLKAELENCIIEYAGLFEHLSPHAEMHHYADEWKRTFLAANTLYKKINSPVRTRSRTNFSYCYAVFEDGSRESLNATSLVGRRMNAFKGWKCWINDSVFIAPNGDIQLASCSAGRKIGNMNEGRLEMMGEPVICPEQFCGCGTDINIRKSSPRFEQQRRQHELS